MDIIKKRRPTYKNLDFIKDIWSFLRIHKGEFIVYTILLMIVSLIELLPPIILAKIVDFFTTGGTNITVFYKYLAVLFVIIAFNHVLRLGAKHYFEIYTIKIQKATKISSFNKLLELDLIWHEKTNTGNKIEKIEGGRSAIGEFMNFYINQGVGKITSIVGIIVVFAFFGIKYSIVATLFILIYFTAEYKLNKNLANKSLVAKVAKEKSSGKTYEFSSNISTVKAMGIEKSSNKQVSSAEESLVQAKIEKRKASTKKWIIVQIVSTVFYIFFIYLVGKDIIAGILTIGVIIIYVQYIKQLTETLNTISRETNKLIDIKYAVHRMMELFHEIPSINEENAKPLKDWKEIKIQNANFKYKDEPVLEDFSLNIKKGEKIGIVGQTGSGKSTFFKLLLKLYLPKKGTIHFDNKSINTITRNSILEKVSIVPQETEVFNISLRENVMISGNGKNKIQRYKRAIDYSQLLPVINKLKRKDLSLIGEKGVRLSGGERQRLGIARAIYKDSNIIILDESTSNLDYATERKIQQALNKLDKTLIISAHRLSTLERMDKIIFLEKGVVVEQGTYQELLKKRGKFFNLWKEQGGWKTQ